MGDACGALWPLSATQLAPSHFLHVGQVPAEPVVLGLPPQCQPALTTPAPMSDMMVEPSWLTVALPIATKLARSWSYEYISVTARGASPSTFGIVMRAGGLKWVPTGWMVTMKRGCWPKPGDIGTLSMLTGVTDTQPLREPPGKVAEQGAMVRAKPGASGMVTVPPVVSLTHTRLAGLSSGR